ncbi:TIGR03936 family radical SAM-associated protein [Aeromicrobium sp.]|uniref:TIGR03936 family radical SAM-associated protein n=1 Tax=Aeromicrobium sp. TaxID=1871063 RepID=UPI002FCA426B
MTTLEGTPNPEAPNPQLPIVQKLRIRYAKRGRLRFTSHRDFARAFERAIRRSGIPIGHSSGFTPHPKISYANASPTGAASEAEYLEIGMTRECDPDAVRTLLDSALPDGLDIVDVVVAKPGALADRLQASKWDIMLPEVALEDAESAVRAFLAEDDVPIERMMKQGPRILNCREPVVDLVARSDVSSGVPCAILAMVVLHVTPSVRPDDVLAGLKSSGGLELKRTPTATRLAQGPLETETGTVGDPLAFDRDAS